MKIVVFLLVVSSWAGVFGDDDDPPFTALEAVGAPKQDPPPSGASDAGGARDRRPSGDKYTGYCPAFGPFENLRDCPKPHRDCPIHWCWKKIDCAYFFGMEVEIWPIWRKYATCKRDKWGNHLQCHGRPIIIDCDPYDYDCLKRRKKPTYCECRDKKLYFKYEKEWVYFKYKYHMKKKPMKTYKAYLYIRVPKGGCECETVKPKGGGFPKYITYE